MIAQDFYLVCFLLGLVFSVLAFLGAGHLHLGHFHFGHMHGAYGAHGRGIGFVNGFSITAFLCWFGGVGYLLTRAHSMLAGAVLLLALTAGLAGAAVISLFLFKVLLPHERALLPEDTEMRGVVARVSAAVRPGGTGEILFSLNGTRKCAAARSETGAAIERNAQVVVLHVDRGIAWVQPFSELGEDAP